MTGPEFETRYWSVVSCSAITGQGVREGFGMQEMKNKSSSVS